MAPSAVRAWRSVLALSEAAWAITSAAAAASACIAAADSPACALASAACAASSVGFCMSTVCPGRLVILDEPTNDVDPLRRRLLWEQVRGLGNLGCMVLLVTHNVLEAEKSVDTLAVMNHGRVVAEGTPEDVAQVRASHTGQFLRRMLGSARARRRA